MNINIYFLILLIIFLIYLKSIVGKEYFYVINNGWLYYRLGDAVKCYGNVNKEMYLKYPNSIAADYYLKTKNLDKKNQKNNLEVLEKIINSRKVLPNLPENNSIVLHIRLGDTIKDFKNNEFIFSKTHGNWASDISKLRGTLQEIKKVNSKNKIKKVYLVYGAHKKNINVKVNLKFLEEVRNIIRSENLKIQEINTNPDDDFVFMCHSKIFIKSGGGFSKLISKIIRKKGGKIYDIGRSSKSK